MKIFAVIIFYLFTYEINNHLVGSIWISKIASGCVDTLKFKSKGQVTEFSCEQGYTFHGSYIISRDTLIITEKDDSHSEDKGKVTGYRTKYLMTNRNILTLISFGEFENGRWNYKNVGLNEKNLYERIH